MRLFGDLEETTRIGEQNAKSFDPFQSTKNPQRTNVIPVFDIRNLMDQY
jgi:hypothetical protein